MAGARAASFWSVCRVSHGSVHEFLDKLDAKTLREHNARIYYIEDRAKKADRQLKKDAQGNEMRSLAEKRAEMARRNISREGVYIAELRRTEKYRHPLDDNWVKTALRRDVKDHVGVDTAELMPYWDRYDEGIFVGAQHSGSVLHVDQVGRVHGGRTRQKPRRVW